MDLGLRVAGRHTVAFRCGCLFARGDEIGIGGWRLCPSHGELRAIVAGAFDEAGGQCVVICPRAVPHVRQDDPARAEADRS